MSFVLVLIPSFGLSLHTRAESVGLCVTAVVSRISVPRSARAISRAAVADGRGTFYEAGPFLVQQVQTEGGAKYPSEGVYFVVVNSPPARPSACGSQAAC